MELRNISEGQVDYLAAKLYPMIEQHGYALYTTILIQYDMMISAGKAQMGRQEKEYLFNDDDKLLYTFIHYLSGWLSAMQYMHSQEAHAEDLN